VEEAALKTSTKIAAARALSAALRGARRAVGLGPRAVVSRDGLRWDLDLDEGIDLAIYLFGMFERSTVMACRRLVEPGDTVLDIGANIGAHTLHLAREVGEAGAVVAYEPTAFAYGKLRRNIDLNPALAPRILAEQILLVEEAKTAPPPALYSSWPLRTEAGLHAQHRGRLMDTTGARSLTLDEHVEQARLRKVDFIKLDVDGHECPILRGGVRMLRAHRPVLVMELAPYVHVELGHRLEECFDALLSQGYRFRDLDRGTEVPARLSEVERMIGGGASINVIAAAG
jgi:FkbM family methyltransferase